MTTPSVSMTEGSMMAVSTVLQTQVTLPRYRQRRTHSTP